MDSVKRWLKNIFTEDDGESVCVAKVLAVIAFFSFLGYAGYGLFTNHFALEEFSRGLMEVLVGSGGIIAGKQLTQKS